MDDIYYSDRYSDAEYEYRHVILPRRIASLLNGRLLNEAEWRKLGVQQSLGWRHYEIHRPEPHIILFRRPVNFTKKDEEMAKNQLMKDLEEMERKNKVSQRK